jgi:hypothetical protein
VLGFFNVYFFRFSSERSLQYLASMGPLLAGAGITEGWRPLDGNRFFVGDLRSNLVRASRFNLATERSTAMA